MPMDSAKSDRDVNPPGYTAGGLALLTLALLCGVLGFAFHSFWLLAIICMAALWGLMIAGRPRRPPEPQTRTVKPASTARV